jgi:hypothetical protein
MLTSAERETMAGALGCEYHEPGYGECASCASHAERVWDDAVEAIVADRVAKALAPIEALCRCSSVDCPCDGDRAAVTVTELRAAMEAKG